MQNREPKDTTLHKEEMRSKISNNEIDRIIFRRQLESSIDILDRTQHTNGGLINIVIEKVVTDTSVNVYHTL